MAMMRGFRSLALVLALATLPVAARAQAPEERAAIEKLRDSLSEARDTIRLRRLEAATIDRAKQDRENPVLHLRLGFIAYRLGQLTGDDDRYEDAAGEFEWAAGLRADWPYAWYGLGLAELARGEYGFIAIENIRQQLGKDHLSKAARAFARAVQADPAFAHAAIDLANTALSQRIRPRLDVARDAMRLATATDAGRLPGVQLARGRVERELGEVDSSLAAFQTAVDLGGDSGIALLELARTYFYGGHAPAGHDTYYDAVGAASSAEALGLLRSDLGWVATPDEIEQFDALTTPAERVSWLSRFWERRDATEARDAGERLEEHYRRWFYALRNFRLVSKHRRYDITEVYRTDQREFDDRGVVYLRHGEPDRRASFAGAGVEPNVSWLYRRPDDRGGDLVFHFVAREDVQDYKLIESLADVLGFREALEAQRGAHEGVAALYASRAPFGTVYQRMADGMGSAGRLLAEERRAGRHSISVGTTEDSYRRRFELPLEIQTSDFTVGARGGGSASQELHVIFAVPAKRLAGVSNQEQTGLLYPLRFRLLVTDSSDNVVARLDTARVFQASGGLRSGSYLVGRIGVAVPPGSYRYRLLVTTPDATAGDLLERESIAIPLLDGSRFAVSDLVIGHNASGLRWVSGSDTVSLIPLGRVPERSALELYYEVYGLAAGASYHTVVRLEKEGGGSVFSAVGRLFGGRRAPVLLEFDAPADGPATRVRRTLDMRDTPRGRYRVTVELTDPATGERVTRTRTLEVVDGP
jgi:GWxTD domain-containing protein